MKDKIDRKKKKEILIFALRELFYFQGWILVKRLVTDKFAQLLSESL